MRNRTIANVFSQIGLIEAWRTGLRRIQNAAREYGLPETFRVNLFRKPLLAGTACEAGDVSANVGDNVGEMSVNDGDVKAKIIKLITDNNKASAASIAKSMSVAQRTAERYIRELREEGVLIRHGAARGGYWEVKNKL